MSTIKVNEVQDLNGNTLVKQGEVELAVDNMASLLSVSATAVKVARVLNYHSDVVGGGGVFYWDTTKAKSEHNGGTIIDPSATFPTDWSVTTQQETWFNTSNAGVGCWVRQYDGAVNVKWFGAKGDGVEDDTRAVNKALTLQANVKGVSGTFNCTSDILVESTEPKTITNLNLKLSSTNTIRLKNASHTLVSCTIDGGLNEVIGLTIEATAAGSTLTGCSINDCGRSAVYSTAAGVTIESSFFDSNGSLDTGNFATTLYLSSPTNNFVVNNKITNAVWGVYFRTDLLDTESTKLKCIGNEVNGTLVAASQGISVQNSYYAIISNNTVSNFDDNAIDMQACYYNIVESNVCNNCKDGVFMGDRACSGHVIRDNIFRSCERGVRFVNGVGFENAFFESISILNNTAVSCTDGGFLVKIDAVGSGGVNFKVEGNTISSNSNGTYGILLQGIDQSSVKNNTFNRQPGHNIEIVDCDYVDVSNNIMRDPGFNGAGAFNGIEVPASSTRVMVRDNYAVGSAGVAYNFGGGSNNTCSGNRWRSIVTGVGVAGAGFTQADNLSV